MKIAIIGNGFVGSTIDNGFCLESENFVIDPLLNNEIKDLNGIELDAIFVCVPTPMSQDGSVDASIILEVFSEIKEYCNDCLVVIKSTITPEIIDKILKINKKLVYNPEFLREKHALDDFKNCPTHIFGGKKEYSEQIAKLYKNYSLCKTEDCIYIDINAASLIKYTINSFLALKVIFFNQIHKLFSEIESDISWEEFIYTIASDNRIGSSHMDVPGHDGRFGYGGACFPKDTSALVKFSQNMDSDLTLLKKAIEINNNIRSSYKNLDKREKEQGVFFNKEL
jgi:nucleotide sugar dehydrogenase